MAISTQDITRIALGRQCSLGQLYNVVEDKLLEGFVFLHPQKVEKDLSISNDLNITQIQCTVDDSFSQRHEELDIPPDQKLGLMVDLHDSNLKGYKELLKWKKTSDNMIRGTLTYTVFKSKQTLDFKKCFNRDMFISPMKNGYLPKSTHVINEVMWGARLILTFDCLVVEDKDYQKVRQQMESLLQRIKVCCETANSDLKLDEISHLDIKVGIHGDTWIPNLQRHDRHVRDSFEILMLFPQLIQDQRKWNVLFFKLFPLSKINLKSKFVSNLNIPYFKPIDFECSNRVENYFEEIYQAHGTLKDFIGNIRDTRKCLISPGTYEMVDIRHFEKGIEDKITKQKKIIKDLILNSRSNGSPASASLRFNNIRSVISVSSITEFLDKYRFYVDGVKYMKTLKTEIPDCQYLTNGSDLKTVMREHNEGYVLVYNPKCSDLFQRREWQSNFELFMVINDMKICNKRSFVLCLMEQKTSGFGYLKLLVPFNLAKDADVSIQHFYDRNLLVEDCVKNRNSHLLTDLSDFLLNKAESQRVLSQINQRLNAVKGVENVNSCSIPGFKELPKKHNTIDSGANLSALDIWQGPATNVSSNSISSQVGVSKYEKLDSVSREETLPDVHSSKPKLPLHTNNLRDNYGCSEMRNVLNHSAAVPSRTPIRDDDRQQTQIVTLRCNTVTDNHGNVTHTKSTYLNDLVPNAHAYEYGVHFESENYNSKTSIETGTSENQEDDCLLKPDGFDQETTVNKNTMNSDKCYSSKSNDDVSERVFGGSSKPNRYASPMVSSGVSQYPKSFDLAVNDVPISKEDSKLDGIPSKPTDSYEMQSMEPHNSISSTQHTNATYDSKENNCNASTIEPSENQQIITPAFSYAEMEESVEIAKRKNNGNGKKANSKNKKKGKSGQNSAKDKFSQDEESKELNTSVVQETKEKNQSEKSNDTNFANNEEQITTCVAKCEGQFSSSSTIGNDLLPLNLVCPASLYEKCGMTNVHTWSCVVCHSQLSYGFDQHIYCSSCGNAPAASFSFHCSHPSHGEEYYQFSKEDDLYGMLENLRQLEFKDISDIQQPKGKNKSKSSNRTQLNEHDRNVLSVDASVDPLFIASSTGDPMETDDIIEEQIIRCIAKSEVSFTNIKSSDAVLLSLVCPGSLYVKCNTANVRNWTCAICDSNLSYGFDDHIYCSSCGKAPVSSFSFHCSHPSHGEEYFKFPNDYDLYGMLEKLRPREELNILVMGETGVGKSTFINAFANYLTYDTFDEAEASELIGLIPTSFTLSDENFDVITVKFGEEDQNEAEEDGASKTQSCKCYSFPCGEKMVRLIDTPGIGDTRGIDQDAKNFVNILSFISNYPKLHGILLLMKPNSSRLSIFFRFCIQELLTHLHKSASENIVFVFTNAKSTFYKPGDTLPPLKKLLKELQDVVIPLHRETLYCLDNDAFRFLVALRNEVKFNEADRKEYSFSWRKTTEECERLLNHIALLKPHAVKETLSINEARRTISSLAQPLVDILVVVQENLFHINRQLKHIQASKNNLNKLRNNLFVPVVHTEMINLSNPKTVCRSQKCYNHETEGIEPSNACHDPCHLEGLQTEIVNNTELKRCAIFDRQNNCQNCGCSWKDHMHIRYEMKKSNVVKKMDSGVSADMNNWRVRQEKAEEIKTALEDQRRDYTRELDYIIIASAMFMYFLTKNCLTHQPDVLKDYLDHVVQLEKSKRRYGNEASNKSGLLEALEQASSEYDRELKTLQKQNQVATAQEIGVNVSMLYSLPIFGKNFKNIAEHYERGHAQEVAMYSERVYVPKKGTGRRQRFNFS